MTCFFLFCLAASYSHGDKVPTTIGAKELNFRVRYGNGCDLFAIVTRLFVETSLIITISTCFSTIFFFDWKIILSKLDKRVIENHSSSFWLSPRSISIRQLHVSPRFHLEPIYLIVFEGSYLLA